MAERAMSGNLGALGDGYAQARELLLLVQVNPLLGRLDDSTGQVTPTRLWHRSAPRTSQRRAIGNLGNLLTLILGGNRSGKTEAGAQLAVACAMGGGHPAVQGWLRVNGLPLDLLPYAPQVVWASSLTSKDSRRYIRSKLDSYLPLGTKRRKWNADDEAEARLPGWVGADGREYPGGLIVCKAARQGREAYQGDAVYLGWMDEEHPKDVADELAMRTVDKQGKLLMTMTPLKGLTWVYRDHVAKADPDTRVHWLHGVDNPHVDPAFLQRLVSRYPAGQQAARLRGEFVALEGRVYQDWSRQLHVVPSFRIPDSWPRYRGWDFGTRNPTAVVWVAVDPADHVLHVYRVHHRANWTLRQHAKHVREVEACPACWQSDAWTSDDAETWIGTGTSQDGTECASCGGAGRFEPEPEYLIADPAGKAQRLSLGMDYGFSVVKGPNSVQAGIDAVQDLLSLDVEGRPHLLVHDSCSALIEEFGTYRWKARPSGYDGPEQPIKESDHALDALRYVVAWLAKYQGLGADAAPA